MKKTLTIGIGFTFAAVLANATAINTLTPGGAIITATAVSSLPSATLIGTASGSFLGASDISGNYMEWAYSDLANPYGPGDDTFVLKITVGPNTGGNVIESATLGGWGAYSVTADYLAGSAQGAGASESVGDTVKYTFAPVPAGPGPGLTPGEIETLVLYTNASSGVGPDLISIQDGSSGNGSGLSPAVPEPMSMSLVGGGLALLGMLRFRRNK
jgi:hypothetical protein